MNKTRKHSIDMMVADGYYSNNRNKSCAIVVQKLSIIGDTIQEVEENLQYATQNSIQVFVANSNLAVTKTLKG